MKRRLLPLVLLLATCSAGITSSQEATQADRADAKHPVAQKAYLKPAEGVAPASPSAPRLVSDGTYPPYTIVKLKADNVPAKAGVIWRVSPSKGVSKATQSHKATLEFVAPPGTYEVTILVVSLSPAGETDIQETSTNVTITEPGPGPGPGPKPPGPNPPGPTPPGPTPPGPNPSPAPIPEDGFRVLIVYESAELPKYPAGQTNALYARIVRDYLRAKCVVGADGKTREYRIWDKDVDASAESALWQAALKRPRTSTPWIVISTGKTGYEGPLPDSAEKTLELLKKYGG